ncbi:DUF721 domain-containing protein [Roseospira marina]|uniref:DUF721 domain-containing protein n=1 Tax=Roseospira marina TaxID=140057 RepID=A0A5M6ID13_9PROT|nr:DUF721 domain-containing protein [Roseospira marina]KAA5606170.1 DUF721 domain-containing protein [Roseospira marina]MBB4314311.1 hypothetical protein [Roseospira marina]MBB5087471.1 hypothetical protein [Roseospira marina]
MASDNTPAQRPVSPAWLRRLVTQEGERLPVRDLTQRSQRSRTVGHVLEPATRRLLGRRGLALGPILTHWEAIVGPTLARHCLPVRLVMPPGKRSAKGAAGKGPKAPPPGGTLHVKVAGGAFATEITYRAPLLCERINTHLGYAAVTSIRVTQGPVARPSGVGPRHAARALPPPPPSPQAKRALQDKLAQVTDPELRAVLERLGTAVMTAHPPGRPPGRGRA